MSKKSARFYSGIIAAILCVAMLAGCGASPTGSPSPQPSASQPAATAAQTSEPAAAKHYWELLDEVSDSSELPDWTGDKVTLSYWNSHGTGGGNPPRLHANDVVIKEIERVTGIVIDVDNYMDNNGVTISAKIPMMVAAGDYPDIVYNTALVNLVDLVEGGKLYDLTDMYEEYCDQLANKLPRDTFSTFYEMNHMYNGRQYTLPTGVHIYDFYFSSPESFPDFDLARYQKNMTTPTSKGNVSGNSMVWVRDDILQALFPNAKTLDDIKAIYEQNGTFTRDEIFDVDLKTFDDVIQMLYNVQAYIKEKGLKSDSGQLMDVTYGPYVGMDNWSWLKLLPEMIDGVMGEQNYFTQFNKLTGKLELAYKMDYVVNEMKAYNRLVRDNIMAKDSLIDNKTIFEQKVNTGQYAVLYAQKPPNVELKEAGKDYQYRPVWVDQAYREDQQAAFKQYPKGGVFSIFKDSVSEKELPQVLHFFNYMYSKVGAKMLQWGPASAGLFEEKNGKLTYTNPQLEANMVSNEDNGINAEYGMQNGSVGTNPFGLFATGLNQNLYSPKYIYDVSRDGANALKYFTPGILKGESVTEYEVPVVSNANIWNYTSAIESLGQFWSAREGFEKQMIKVIASESDAQFETQYQLLVQYAEANGLTDQALKDLNELFLSRNGDALRDAGLID